jgi:hypothetical protein
MRKLSFEIKTQTGGSVQSLKNSPQDLFTTRYQGNRDHSLEVFKQSVNSIPPGIQISQMSFVEPFGGINALSCNYNQRDDSCG